MSSNQNNNIQFQLRGIEILNTEINSPKKPFPQNVVFHYDIALEQRISVEKGLVFVVCNISTFAAEIPDNALGKIKSGCVFEVVDLEKYVTKDKAVKLPDEFTTTLNSIAISTTRGIMFSFFRGTVLHGAILPLVNPKTDISPKEKK